MFVCLNLGTDYVCLVTKLSLEDIYIFLLKSLEHYCS
jgi:hypothetical protein